MREILFCIILLYCLIQCDKNTLFKFKTFSLEGRVHSDTENVAYFYGIPYAHPLIQNNKGFLFERPKDIFDGGKPHGSFQSRIDNPDICLGQTGTPLQASFCLDFDLFVPSPVDEGEYTVKCPDQRYPSLTFIWHVDILAKNRSAIHKDAISMARDSGALVVILYYRSGFLGFSNVNEATTNIGFEDIKLGYLQIVHMSRHFCIQTDRMVYSGNGATASDLVYLSMADYPYSGMYALFGGSLTLEKQFHPNQLEKLSVYFSCNNISCLVDKITRANNQNFGDILKVTESMGPWLPHAGENRQPFSTSHSIPVLYGLNLCDGCSMASRWYHGDLFPPTSDGQLIEAIQAVLIRTGIGGDQPESAAWNIFNLYMEIGEKSFETIFCRFIQDSFGMYDIWNSPFDVLKDVTFVGFHAACPNHQLSPFFPFSSDVGAGIRDQLIQLTLAYVEYNSKYIDSNKWRFGRTKTANTLLEKIYGNGNTSFGSIVRPKEFELQNRIRSPNFEDKIKNASTYNWKQIISILFACVALVFVCSVVYWIIKSRKPKSTGLSNVIGFEFPGVHSDPDGHKYYWKEETRVDVPFLK